MAAYDDNKWVQTLKSLNLSQSDYEKARILLASKDAGFRQGMLGGSSVDSNKCVILMALGGFFFVADYCTASSASMRKSWVRLQSTNVYIVYKPSRLMLIANTLSHLF